MQAEQGQNGGENRGEREERTEGRGRGTYEQTPSIESEGGARHVLTCPRAQEQDRSCQVLAVTESSWQRRDRTRISRVEEGCDGQVGDIPAGVSLRRAAAQGCSDGSSPVKPDGKMVSKRVLTRILNGIRREARRRERCRAGGEGEQTGLECKCKERGREDERRGRGEGWRDEGREERS